MYNRYVPQPDGSFRRNRLPDVANEPPRPEPPREPRQEPPQQQPQPPQTCPNEQETPPFRKGPQSPPMRGRPSPPPRQFNPPRPQPRKDTGVGSFLRQLLPKDFNTEDLLVVLLLLLMSADCQEDQNSALLTLALYLFL